MGCVTYTDASRKDIGILQDATCDFAFGDDENSFSVTLDRSAGLSLEPCSLAYIEGTEFGGMITQCDTDTDPSVDTLIYNGLTWHGMLNTHVIEPDAGTDHYVVSGEANAVLAQLVAKLGIGDLFAASKENSRVRINNYQFNRYVEAYTGIRSMLVTVGCKLHIEYDGEKAILSAAPIADYSTTQAVDTDKLVLQMSKTFLPVNHLICLGEGELKERTVIHLYANEKGIVSQTQTFFGSMENALVYDYSSAEADELLEEGKKKLEELQCCDSSEAKFFEDRDYDIDDIVGTYDAFTGEFVTATIAKKILSVDRRGTMTVDYQIGNVVSSNVSMTGSSDSINLYTRVSQAETTANNASELATDAAAAANEASKLAEKAVQKEGDTMSGALAFGDTGANGGWINGKTQFSKVPIHFNIPHVVDGSRFDPLIAGKDVNGNYWAFGQGAGQEICFVGFKANRTENGVDWKVSINTLTGALSSSNIAPNVPLMAYPVGAVYISNNSTSPASLFGGSWTPVDGVFPRFNAFSEGIRNGGSNTHTLSAAEMPAHTHGLSTSVYLNDNSVTKSGAHSTWWNTKRNDTKVTASSSGGGGAHNNVPYYRTFYAWIRTA